MNSLLNWVLLILILLPLFLYPLFPTYALPLQIDDFFGVGSFYLEFTAAQFLFIFNFVLVFVVAALGLNVQTGFAGQLNLGFAGFMAIGGYSAALVQMMYPQFFVQHPLMGIFISLAVSAFMTALIGFLFCLPTLRLRGDYFAIVTFGFAELVRQVIKNEPWTQGANGINNLFLFPESDLESIKESLSSAIFESSGALSFLENLITPEDFAAFQLDYWIQYLFFVVLTGFVIWVVCRLRDSHFGRALFALRENATAAEACGISLTKAKILAFLVSSAIGGIAGYMLVVRNGNAHPNAFTFMISVYVLCAIVLGGMGSVRGAVIGALILMSLGEFLRDVLGAMPKVDGTPIVPAQTRIILFGLILVLMMRFRPNGVITLESETRRLAKQQDLEKVNEDPSPSSYYQIGRDT